MPQFHIPSRNTFTASAMNSEPSSSRYDFSVSFNTVSKIDNLSATLFKASVEFFELSTPSANSSGAAALIPRFSANALVSFRRVLAVVVVFSS